MAAGGACCVSSGSGCTGCGGCGGSCSTGCGGCGGCGGACAPGCTACTSCTGTCSGTCTGGCGGCRGGCTSCTGSCSGCSGCSGSCQGTCTSNCADNCGSTCKTTCTGDCMSNCSGVAYANLAANLALTELIKANNFNDIQTLVSYEMGRRRLTSTSAKVTVGNQADDANIKKIVSDLSSMGHGVSSTLAGTATAGAIISKQLGQEVITKAKAAYNQLVQLIPG